MQGFAAARRLVRARFASGPQAGTTRQRAASKNSIFESFNNLTEVISEDEIATTRREASLAAWLARPPASSHAQSDSLDSRPERIASTCRWAEGKSRAVNPSVATNRKGFYINSNFDSGNVEIVSLTDPDDIQLNIREDPYCETDGRAHYQCALAFLPSMQRAHTLTRLRPL